MFAGLRRVEQSTVYNTAIGVGVSLVARHSAALQLHCCDRFLATGGGKTPYHVICLNLPWGSSGKQAAAFMPTVSAKCLFQMFVYAGQSFFKFATVDFATIAKQFHLAQR